MLYQVTTKNLDLVTGSTFHQSDAHEAHRRVMKSAGRSPVSVRVYGRESGAELMRLLAREPDPHADRVTVEVVGSDTVAGGDMLDDANDEVGGGFEQQAARDIRWGGPAERRARSAR